MSAVDNLRPEAAGAPKVKICGLRSVEAAIAAREAGADYAGTILAKGFKRTVDEGLAVEIRRALEEQIPLVGVFVNDEPSRVINLLNSGTIDIAQLHGSESVAEIIEIKQATGKPVWKVFKMDASAGKEALTAQRQAIEESPADMVLLDAGTGTGERFDWSLTEGICRPFILAGGLIPENVAQAIAQTHTFAVDTSSGVETDGVKDTNKIFAFCEAARRQ